MGIKSIEETIGHISYAQFRNIVENCLTQVPETKWSTFVYAYSYFFHWLIFITKKKLVIKWKQLLCSKSKF